MPYEMILQSVDSLSFNEQISLISYLANIVNQKNQINIEKNLQAFNSMCLENQQWATSVGMTENDIFETLAELRQEKHQ